MSSNVGGARHRVVALVTWAWLQCRSHSAVAQVAFSLGSAMAVGFFTSRVVRDKKEVRVNGEGFLVNV
jgi:hypothetical protein